MWQRFLDRKLVIDLGTIRDALIILLAFGGGSWSFGWLLPRLFPIAVALVRSTHHFWDAHSLLGLATGGAVAVVVAFFAWATILFGGMILLRLGK